MTMTMTMTMTTTMTMTMKMTMTTMMLMTTTTTTTTTTTMMIVDPGHCVWCVCCCGCQRRVCGRGKDTVGHAVIMRSRWEGAPGTPPQCFCLWRLRSCSFFSRNGAVCGYNATLFGGYEGVVYGGKAADYGDLILRVWRYITTSSTMLTYYVPPQPLTFARHGFKHTSQSDLTFLLQPDIDLRDTSQRVSRSLPCRPTRLPPSSAQPMAWSSISYCGDPSRSVAKSSRT
eukprot:3941249-Rhodomonas_salina.1